MAATVIPAILDALIDQLPDALSTAIDYEVVVFDGFGTSSYDPGDYVMVGVEDPDLEDMAFSASSAGSWAHAGGDARDEQGEVVLAALSWNGDGDQRLARDRAFAIVAAVNQHLVANHTLGLDQVLWVVPGSDIQFSQQQAAGGATALVVFKVAFRARI